MKVIIAVFNSVVLPLSNFTAKYKGSAEIKNITTKIRNAINTAVVNIPIIFQFDYPLAFSPLFH